MVFIGFYLPSQHLNSSLYTSLDRIFHPQVKTTYSVTRVRVYDYTIMKTPRFVFLLFILPNMEELPSLI